MKTSLLFGVIFWLLPVWATIINPLPIDKQLKSSYAVIHGKYMGKSFKLDKNGEVVTDHSFQILRSVGLTPNEIINKNDFKITAPGGSWQGISYVVHSTPQFNVGDEAILLIGKRREGGYLFQNLSLGKYEINHRGDEIYLTSALFPHHPALGNIDYNLFEKNVEEVFGHKLTQIDDREIFITRDYKVEKNDKKKRRPASDEEEQNEFVQDQGQYRLAMFWLVLILAMSGAARAFFVRKKNR